jgi:hypothetical protein
MVRRKLHLEVRIRSSPPFPCSSGASNAGGGCVELCARRISWNLIISRVCWCGFVSVSFDLPLSSVTMVVALMRWSFGALARRLPVCQALLRQALSGFVDGWARMAARLRTTGMAGDADGQTLRRGLFIGAVGVRPRRGSAGSRPSAYRFLRRGLPSASTWPSA